VSLHEALALECAQDDQADEGARGEKLAVGEIDELDNAVHHGIAQGDEGIDAP
jgi:hypothetical protein